MLDYKWNLPIEEVSCPNCGNRYMDKVDFNSGVCNSCKESDDLIDYEEYIKKKILHI